MARNAQCPHARSDPDRPVLVGKLAAEMEPHRANGVRRQGAQRLGECTTVRGAQHGAGGWLYRHGGVQEPLQLLASGHRDSRAPVIQTWTPLHATPPDQDYPSGHSIEGGVGAEVLKQIFGTDQISFKDCGATLPAGSTCYDATPVTRSYTSFTQAADENGYSRVLVGFHFHNATDVGTAYGRKIGERAAGMLPPIK